MKLTPLNIPALMKKYGLYADKRLGQNFLVDESALLKVVHSAELSETDWVLEGGAGLGNLTRHLSREVYRVVAVEIDKRLFPALVEVTAPFPNIQIIHADILKINVQDIFSEIVKGESKPHRFCVVANIPYYITSAVIRHLLEGEVKPDRLVLTIQREVAERICANPGKMSLLSLSVQVYGKPEITSHIPAGSFFPKPNVDSSILRVQIYPQPVIDQNLLDTFFKLIKAGFTQKRKTLRNAFRSGLGISSEKIDQLFTLTGIDSTRRAETLTIPEWNRLCSSYSQEGEPE